MTVPQSYQSSRRRPDDLIPKLDAALDRTSARIGAGSDSGLRTAVEGVRIGDGSCLCRRPRRRSRYRRGS